MFIKDKLINYFGKNLKLKFQNINQKYFENCEEIRIRVGKGIIFKNFDEELFLDIYNNLTLNQNNIYIPTKEDILNSIEIMSEYSIYAIENELKNGFISLEGGFRVGIVGKVILENEKIKTIKNISSINIRIAREKRGCSKEVLGYILNPLKSTIIISPPNCGKTTLLRDIIRNISDFKYNVSLIDERSEIASIHNGQASLDVGIRTDILDKCPKAEGIYILLRSMSPDVIALDELGGDKDVEAVEKISNCGIKIICTMHAKDIEDIKQKKSMQKLLDNKIFERYIVLNRQDKICNISKIYDKNLETIYRKGN